MGDRFRPILMGKEAAARLPFGFPTTGPESSMKAPDMMQQVRRLKKGDEAVLMVGATGPRCPSFSPAGRTERRTGRWAVVGVGSLAYAGSTGGNKVFTDSLIPE